MQPISIHMRNKILYVAERGTTGCSVWEMNVDRFRPEIRHRCGTTYPKGAVASLACDTF